MPRTTLVLVLAVDGGARWMCASAPSCEARGWSRKLRDNGTDALTRAATLAREHLHTEHDA